MSDASNGTEPREAPAVSDRLKEKVRILERHGDHLMGQLYHQVGLIRDLRDRSEHLAKELDSIRDTPKLLDDALSRIARLKEELTGRKEVELDLRRRIEELEREERTKVQHIRRLEQYLHRIWYSPHRRAMRSLKIFAMKVLGRDGVPEDLKREE